MAAIIEWDGGMITEPGLYRGIPLETYHNDIDLLNGPSVSKSSIKHIAPPSGSPKKFWKNWAGNPKRKKQKPTQALVFGKAVHAILLGDEVFEEKFVVRPEKVAGYSYHHARKEWQQWYREQAERGLEVITEEQIDQIRDMAEDAADHPLVLSGGLNGDVEISMFAKDPKTGIWLKSRPDVAVTDGLYNDVKSAADLDDDFLRRQFESMGYHLQAAMTKKVCDLLQIPFIAFGFLYCLSKDYGDTEYRVADMEDIEIGCATIDYGLAKIREGLSTGNWPGASIYTRENVPMRMTKWAKDNILDTLKREGYWQ